MKDVIKGIALVGMGAIAAFVPTYLYFRKKLEDKDEEIEAIRKYYYDKNAEREENLKKIEEHTEKIDEEIVKIQNEPKSISDYTTLIGEITKEKVSDEEMNAEAEAPEEEKPDKPYMISEEEYMSNDTGYEQISLTYFTQDDTLADDCDEMVDIEETISTEIFNQIAECDDGDYFVRNDVLQCDYEIMKVDQSYKERYGFEY